MALRRAEKETVCSLLSWLFQQSCPEDFRAMNTSKSISLINKESLNSWRLKLLDSSDPGITKWVRLSDLMRPLRQMWPQHVCVFFYIFCCRSTKKQNIHHNTEIINNCVCMFSLFDSLLTYFASYAVTSFCCCPQPHVGTPASWTRGTRQRFNPYFLMQNRLWSDSLDLIYRS